MVGDSLTVGSSLKPESSNNVAVLKAKLPEDMFIPPADLNVSSIIGQGTYHHILE